MYAKPRYSHFKVGYYIHHGAKELPTGDELNKVRGDSGEAVFTYRDFVEWNQKQIKKHGNFTPWYLNGEMRRGQLKVPEQRLLNGLTPAQLREKQVAEMRKQYGL